MANILLLDDNPVAQKALAGILGRAEHKFAVANTVEEAMRFILQNVEIDLFIVDLRLQASAGQPMNLIRTIRANSFLKSLPILVYTSVTGKENVKAALALRVQNYLIKPYSEEKIYTEIRRAEEWAWIKGHFDDPRSFCAQMGLTLDAWKLLLEDLLAQIQAIVPLLRLVVEARSLEPCAAKLGNLIKSSEACGFWTLYDVLNELVGAADNQQWIRVHNLSASVALADKFVMHMIEPDRFQSGFVDADQFGVERIVRDPSSWLSDDILQRCPLADHDGALARVMRLGSFPVGEGKAAAFRLAADGRGASIQNVLDVVRSDPPLGALLVQSVNKRTDDPDSMIEDSLQAVQMLGGFKLREAATQMNVVEEKCFDLPPIVNSHRFWMYQYGCAQVCEFVCEFMEIPIFMPHAYWAGMYHDLGKSALAMAYPESFVAAAKLSHELSIPMNDAYVKLIGITPSEAGAALARSCHLPPWVVNVMRHVRKPEAAVEDRELVHIVSFCSNLCLRYEIGSNGDLPPPPDMPLDAFPGWAVMSQRVFPSFDIRRFGDVMASWSADLLKNMSGRGSFVTD